MEEIEGKFSLWEKEVPKVRWKGRIDAGQDCQEMVLEHANGMLNTGLWQCMSGGMSWKVAMIASL